MDTSLNGLIVDLNADRNYSENILENYFVDNQEYLPQNTSLFGNFGMSTVLIKTAFQSIKGSTSDNFEDFRNNRPIIAERLAGASAFGNIGTSEEGYPLGFGKDQQSVLLYSFLSAYTGVAPGKIKLNPIPGTPLPNWTIKYTGLTESKALSKIFKRFALNHAYRAAYTLNNFQTNFNFDATQPEKRDRLDNFIPEKLYANVTLMEQFNPLMRLDMEFHNSLKVLAELRKERSLSLSLDNNLITESNGDEYVVGMGYRVKDLRFNTNFGGRKVILKGDLNIKADFSYRNNITVLRNLEYDNNQVTAGQRLMAIKLTADYAISRNLTALFFYDHNFSEFAISTAFPQTSIRSGFTIRYNFGN